MVEVNHLWVEQELRADVALDWVSHEHLAQLPESQGVVNPVSDKRSQFFPGNPVIQDWGRRNPHEPAGKNRMHLFPILASAEAGHHITCIHGRDGGKRVAQRSVKSHWVSERGDQFIDVIDFDDNCVIKMNREERIVNC